MEAPSLGLLAAEVANELSWQERRSDALDSKAGVILGFSGVLGGLSLDGLGGAVGDVGLGAAAIAALTAGVAFLPRSFPTIELVHLREAYLVAEVAQTRLNLVDTRLAMHQRTQRVLSQKAALVSLASAALGVAVILVVLGAILG